MTFDENSLKVNAKDPADPNSVRAKADLPDRMVVPTKSYGDVTLYLRPRFYLDGTPRVRNVMLRISGGADSALLLYMLAIFKRDYNPNIRIFLSTSINPTKPYQYIFADAVIKKVKELTGVEFEEHMWKECDGSSAERYRESQGEFINEIVPYNKIEILFNGETMNPTADFLPLMTGTRDETRDGPSTKNGAVTFARNAYPFRNFNKKAIAELYEHFGLTETLFPITRSCEKLTTNPADFAAHCDACWFCEERKWGFGRLV